MSSPQVWAAAVVAVLAGVGSFVASANWPIAILLISQTVSLVVIYMWVRQSLQESAFEQRVCEKKLKKMRFAVLRLYHFASKNSGGKRKEFSMSLEELFSEDDPPEDETGVAW